jgi:hypothetical protein
VERHRSKLERPTARICDLLLGPPPDRAWLADHLDEAARQCIEELAVWQQAEAELEPMRSSKVWF